MIGNFCDESLYCVIENKTYFELKLCNWKENK